MSIIIELRTYPYALVKLARNQGHITIRVEHYDIKFALYRCYTLRSLNKFVLGKLTYGKLRRI